MTPARLAHLRLFALLLVGALGLHELRYLLALGGHAHQDAASHGHAYLSIAGPLVVMLATGALTALVLRSVTAPASSPRRVRLTRLWPLLSLGLLVLFTGQELLEGALTAGHPSGLDGVFGHGGWVAVPIAAGLGGVLALTVRVVERLAASRLGAAGSSWGAHVDPVPSLVSAIAPSPGGAPAPLACHLAGRAPPSTSPI